MVDGVGVCTVCAKVCHKDHEISYAKYGSFFCDCGAKEDGSCLVRDPCGDQVCSAGLHLEKAVMFSQEGSTLMERLEIPAPPWQGLLEACHSLLDGSVCSSTGPGEEDAQQWHGLHHEGICLPE